MPWAALCEVIEPHYPKPGNGRPPVGLERMLRMYFVKVVVSGTRLINISGGEGQTLPVSNANAPWGSVYRMAQRNPPATCTSCSALTCNGCAKYTLPTMARTA